jgi:hypothetical protein
LVLLSTTAVFPSLLHYHCPQGSSWNQLLSPLPHLPTSQLRSRCAPPEPDLGELPLTSPSLSLERVGLSHLLLQVHKPPKGCTRTPLPAPHGNERPDVQSQGARLEGRMHPTYTDPLTPFLHPVLTATRRPT